MKSTRFALAPFFALLLTSMPLVAQGDSALKTLTIQGASASQESGSSVDAVVEAVRQSTMSAQVPGAVTVLNAKPGDRVKAGQLLMRLDGRAAENGVSASAAQAEAAQAAYQVASKEYERQKQLFQKQYISQSALDRAQAQLDASRAQMKALQAQTGVARAQSGFFNITAPYDGIVSEVPVNLGDMAMPGRTLLSMYDPKALRVTAAIPQSTQAKLGTQSNVQFELPNLPTAAGLLKPVQVQWLPTVDAATHTVQLRLLMPPITNVTPGMFARVWLPVASNSPSRVFVPASAIVHRAEMVGVYVLSSAGRPLLRQVRLGQTNGDQVEVLSGLSKGDKLALEPQLAAKVR